MAAFPPALVRAIVAAMRRKCLPRDNSVAEMHNGNRRIHLLRALSHCWRAEIDVDARCRGIALQILPVGIHYVRFFFSTMPVALRRRAQAWIFMGGDFNISNREMKLSLSNVLHVLVHQNPVPNHFAKLLTSNLSPDTRSITISMRQTPRGGGAMDFSWVGAHLARLRNLRYFSLGGGTILFGTVFSEGLATADFQKLLTIEFRLANVFDLQDITQILRAVPSLQKLNLCGMIPIRQRDALFADLGDLAEKVII